MPIIEIGRRRTFFFIASIAVIGLFFNVLLFSGNELQEKISRIPVPGRPHPPTSTRLPTFPDEDDVGAQLSPSTTAPTATEVPDSHPISALMVEADSKWRYYEGSRSMTFRQTLEKYRSQYGRHPPPGFKEWYIFARKRNVFNIDDFEQIMDDLRPFWAIDPKTIRTHAAHMWEDPNFGIAGIHIRNHNVVRVDHQGWRTDTFVGMLKVFIDHLPDMDIAMNQLDQPRVVIKWEDMQAILAKECETRSLPPEVLDSFSTSQDALLNMSLPKEQDNSTRLSADWFWAPGKQYMKIAHHACPPDSPANSNASISTADAMYKEPLSGIITNFNLSSDLCTVGPAIQRQHGMLFSASSIIASHVLVPIFGECKVNVNSDILFPANMYYRHDQRYDYSEKEDLPWVDKNDTMIWRGVTSGGVQIYDNWESMHRQRLVRLLNGTYMAAEGKKTTILTESEVSSMLTELGTYEPTHNFNPEKFAREHTDVGFVESWGCVPNCSFYDTVFSWKPQTTLTSQFRSRYLIDVDGHSFSGRWHAFLQSKSLGFKATIFREWHDSRLLAWRHFVPVDNRYDDLYSLLTYFIGVGGETSKEFDVQNPGIYVPRHEGEAKKLARQGREWANKALRREDIEVYMFRLMLEYARVVDDNRDRIGYSGDGSELDRFDLKLGKEEGGSLWGLGGWFRKGGKKGETKDLD